MSEIRFFDDLGRELRRVAATERTRSRRRWVSSAGVLAVASMLVVAIVVGGVALLHARRSSHAASTTAPQTISPAARSLLNTVGVLRRPQTKADLDPALLRLLKRPGLIAILGTPDIPLIRLAAVTPWGSRVFLVPRKPLSATALGKLPPQLRELASRGRTRLGSAETLQLMEVSAGGTGGSGGGGGTATDLKQHGEELWGGAPGSATRAVMVVPDGVSRVSLLFPRQEAPHGLTYTRSVVLTAPVHNNVIAVEIHRVVDNPFQYMLWYGPAGHLIKRFGSTTKFNRVIPPAAPAP